MATRMWMPLAIVGASLLLAGTAAAVEEKLNVEYSADQVIEAEEVAMKSRVFHTPTKERREMSQGGQNMIIIMRHDKKVSWTVMPEEHIYMEAAMKPSADKDKTDMSAYKIEQTPVGQEMLNGVNMNKSKIIMTHSSGSKMGGFMWTTKEGIMAKIDAIAVEKGSKDRFKMEQTNIKVGKQPADLFELPRGVEKMDMGGMGMDMMKDMMGR
ncbi:MAG: hypothetical protein E8D46_12910 [Nitrospira sp.]|nr:MAG: hypothetical protein E8D46_12910 [Nitrospira sp.]